MSGSTTRRAARLLGFSAPSALAGWPRVVLEGLAHGYRPTLERLRAGPVAGEGLEALHLDVLRRLDGFRVLCAHQRGTFGVEGPKDAAQRALSAAGLLDPVGAWWLGRPVLVTRNDDNVGRYNGDIGVVVRDAASGQWPFLPRTG